MTKSLPLLGLCLLACSRLHAFAPHPSVLTTKVKDDMLPVVKVIGTDPVVLVDNQEQRLRLDPLYLVQRTDFFGPGYVQLVKASLTGISLKSAASPQDDVASDVPEGDIPGGTAYFDATLKSRDTLKGGFVVVSVYTAASLVDGSAGNKASSIVHDLPDLPAGVEVRVKISSALFKQGKGLGYFVQVFDETGHEVLTSNLEPAWQYYAMRERIQLRSALQKYRDRYPSSNHSASPVVMTRPIFKDGVTPPKSAVSALLSITADGLVSEVTVRGVEDAEVRKSIVDALRGWLFLPQLKGGEPVDSKVQVPLQF